jgi:hypothetical protein
VVALVDMLALRTPEATFDRIVCRRKPVQRGGLTACSRRLAPLTGSTSRSRTSCRRAISASTPSSSAAARLSAVALALLALLQQQPLLLASRRCPWERRGHKKQIS